jgi:ankyrin repeat protein
LSWAAGRGFSAVAEELLNVPNIKVDTQDRNGFTPLLWAARKGSLPIVKMMIDKNADANTIGMNNITPLIVSCKNGHEEVSLFLLQNDEINVNHTDKVIFNFLFFKNLIN